MRKYLLMLIAIFAMNSLSQAQTLNQNAGWLFLMNTTKFNDKWGMHVDFQIRTQDEWDGVRNVLIRPGVTYYINNSNEVTVGYLLQPTFTQLVGTSNTTLTEHRIWEQYIFKHKVSAVNLSHRFRLEQRFIERNGADDLFSQRARYFIRAVVPFKKTTEGFNEGFFGALQNEVFLNLQNKNELNGSTFDQNRAYGAIGYRFSPKVDMEIGYMNQAINGRSNNTNSNNIQLALYTRF